MARDVVTWVGRAGAVAAVVVVGWVLATAWGAVVHGHPLYPVLLALTAFGAVAALVRWARSGGSPGGYATGRRSTADGGSPSDGGPDETAPAARGPGTGRSGLRTAARAAGVLAALAWVGVLGWLRPFGAQDAALAAAESDASVTVTDGATQIVLSPAEPTGPALLFQPGARVDARAYLATLRPIAEAGTPVVVVKQPLGIAFLALGADDRARSAVDAPGWVVGGHSLGGTAAALTAGQDDVAGLLLWASYPAGDESDLTVPVLSVSASEDGLATPADIEASTADLPADTEFVVIEGASHASFGDYGVQPGDGTPTLDAATARARIARASLEFIEAMG